MLAIFLMGFSLLAQVSHAESVSPSCKQCMELSPVSQSQCASCSEFIQEVMLSSNQDRLSRMMDSLRKISEKRCAKAGLDSKACQIYYGLCDGDNASACDSKLMTKLVDHESNKHAFINAKIA